MRPNKNELNKESDSIILTGATGYLGGKLLTTLLRLNYDVVCPYRPAPERSLLKSDKIKWIEYSKETSANFFNEISTFPTKISGIIHTATCYGRRKESEDLMNFANVEMPRQFLEFATLKKLDWFLNVDTCLPDSVNFYAKSKSKFKEIFVASEFQGLKINVPLQQFYGINDNQLISYFVNAFKEDIPSLDCTEGLQERDFLYIDDLIEAFELILQEVAELEKEVNFHEFEIGSGNPLKLKDVILLIKDLCQSKTSINFGVLKARQGEPKLLSYPSKKIRSLGWLPKTNIQNGVKKIIAEHTSYVR